VIAVTDHRLILADNRRTILDVPFSGLRRIQFDIERGRAATLVIVPEHISDEPQVLAVPIPRLREVAGTLAVVGERLNEQLRSADAEAASSEAGWSAQIEIEMLAPMRNYSGFEHRDRCAWAQWFLPYDWTASAARARGAWTGEVDGATGPTRPIGPTTAADDDAALVGAAASSNGHPPATPELVLSTRRE
jgi:hypothetical protein